MFLEDFLHIEKENHAEVSLEERLGVFQPADTKAIHQKGCLDLVTFPGEKDCEAPGCSCQYQVKSWAALGAQVLDICSTGYHLFWDYAVVCLICFRRN